MTIARTPIALALSLLFMASAGHAQLAAIKDGTSNTVQFPERAGGLLPQLGDGSVRNVEPAGASLTTRASVNGSITQTNQATGSLRGTQTAAVGGVNNSQTLSGSIATQGSLTGNLAQLRNNQASTAPQAANIGGVEGSLVVGNANLRGNVSGTLTQQMEAVRAQESGVGQTIDIGGAGNGFQGGTLQTNGTVTAPNITQFQRGATSQQVRAASVIGGNVANASTNGLIASAVSQQATGFQGGGEQSLNVGSLVGSQARQVTTNGTLTAAVSQDTSGTAIQAIDIGSVSNTDAAGTITTQGQVLGGVTQRAGAGTQRLSVAAVRGGAPTEAIARATITGTVNQSMATSPTSEQVVSIGSVEGASGRAQTDAVVGANINQQLGLVGGSNQQAIHIASAINTSGNVNTRAVVNGTLSQNTGGGGTRQTMNLGSAVGTAATVRTDVAISGNLSQVSNQSAAAQTILIGGVVGSGSQTGSDQQ